jgi:hypothetical protein
MPRKPWTSRELDTVRKLYPHVPTSLIAFGLKRKVRSVNYAAFRLLGLRKTPEYMASAEINVNKRGNSGSFRPGIIPHNKGKRMPPGWAPSRMAETQFKPGGRPQTWHPVGAICADREGFLRIKIRERAAGDRSGWDPNVWPLLHWQAWREHKGPIPPGHKVVFRDGDRSHCEIGNLELVTNGEMMRRNSIHNLPPELKQIIQLNGALKRQLRRLCGKEQTE